MIQSMTAYAQREVEGKWGNAIWEIHSVNQRYLEILLRLPEQLRTLEPVIRGYIRSRVTRGKVECNLRVKLVDTNIKRELILNEKFAKQLIAAANWIKNQSDEESIINLVDILRWPGVMSAQEQDLDSISAEILVVFNNILDDFIIARKTEGQVLKTLIEQRLEGIRTELEKIRTYMPEILRWQRERLERLVNRLTSFEIQLDHGRLEQEMALMAQRIDTTEELDRIEAHVKETCSILKKKEAIGRRLDFMMQEFNREANTLASKSINISITNSAIELKVLIEQMREQIQNIE